MQQSCKIIHAFEPAFLTGQPRQKGAEAPFCLLQLRTATAPESPHPPVLQDPLLNGFPVR
jgi:hypothetical protein